MLPSLLVACVNYIATPNESLANGLRGSVAVRLRPDRPSWWKGNPYSLRAVLNSEVSSRWAGGSVAAVGLGCDGFSWLKGWILLKGLILLSASFEKILDVSCAPDCISRAHGCQAAQEAHVGNELLVHEAAFACCCDD